MARQSSKLTARAVATAKPGTHGDGDGLYLDVAKSGGAKKWVFRFVRNKHAREKGLGGYPAVSLAIARQKAQEARQALAKGIDPIDAAVAAKAATTGRKTFGECAVALMASKESEWRNAKHRAQWHQTLGTYARPLWSMPVDEVDLPAVLAVLQPLWNRTPETASRLRGRIEAVLDAARARGLIDANRANPARWKGHLDKLLPRRQKLSRGHHAAMPYADVPGFLAAIRGMNSVASLALEFTILTAARSGEVLGAQWDEIDLTKNLWTIPANRMKAGVAHRVPLSEPAVSILNRMTSIKTNEFIFPGRRENSGLSDSALQSALAKAGVDNVTVHGFRSSFRDWAADCTMVQREIVEGALAHAVGNAVEQAYRRTDALEKRRALMNAWAAFIGGADNNVVRLAQMK